MIECPCCSHIAVGDDRVCTHCHVALPRGVDTQPIIKRWTGRGPDRDRVNVYTDYTRTKEDKQ